LKDTFTVSLQSEGILWEMVAKCVFLCLVCLPLESKRLITKRRTNYAIGITTLIAILYNLPRWWQYSWELRYKPDGELIAEETVTQIGNSTAFKIYTNDIVDLGIRFALPLVLFSFFTWRITGALKEFNAKRRRLSRKDEKEVNVTKIAISVILFSLLTNVFMLCYWIFNQFGKNWHEYAVVFVVLSGITLIANSSMNLVFFLVFGSTFRREFKGLLKGMVCFKGRNESGIGMERTGSSVADSIS
jgi:hypothetical protein